MYNNGDANMLQYIFEKNPTKATTKSYPDVYLSRQKIYEVQYQQQEFLLVVTDIDFVAKN